jgi:hypothetical protein
MMAWKTKAPCWIGGKHYIAGIVLNGKDRPSLDHHTDERHWEQFLVEMKDAAPAKVGPAVKAVK